MRLAGRTALVTGAGRGIGAATAHRLAAEGARVAVNDLDATLARAVADEILTQGGEAVAAPADLLDVDAVDHLVASLVGTWGVPDVVVNNAGTTRDRMFHRMDAETFAFGVDANLTTTVNVTRATVAVMRAAAKDEITRSGTPDRVRKIVFTSSVAALTGNPGQANYTAAKGALISLAKTLASELGPFGITVNVVAPGFVETRLTAANDDGSAELGIPTSVRDSIRGMIALGRLGQPSDIAAVHAFLASSDSDFMSGVTLPVTGGQFGGMG